MGRSEVRVGPPGEVCVCGGELGGPQVTTGQDFVPMWRRAEHKEWKRDVTASTDPRPRQSRSVRQTLRSAENQS